MYFTSGSSRAFEKLMQSKPGFDSGGARGMRTALTTGTIGRTTKTDSALMLAAFLAKLNPRYSDRNVPPKKTTK